MAPKFDLRAAVQRHVAQSRVDLPDATIDELVTYLEDLHASAIEDGASEAEAQTRALAALEESAISLLRRHASRSPHRLHARQADAVARASTGRSLNVLSAIRLAFRQFRQQPTFALVTILVLGLGTGAATTVFTVVDSVVLRPLPYSQPDRLVTLWDTNTEKGLQHDPISPVNFMDYRALPVFKDAAAWWRPGINLVDPGMDPVRVKTIEVSANLFDLLGVKPQVGAGFPPSQRLHSNELIAVISDRLWRTRYSADPSIIGRPLQFNGTPYQIVGVMPPKFHYPDDVDVWQRLRWDLTQHSRAAHFMEAVARLSDDTTFEEAQAATDALGLRLQREFARTNRSWNSRLIPLLDEELGYYRPALMVLFGAVGLLLVIGVLNVASLLLTRALSREREIAVRVTLGAAPRQLVTQLMAESLVLSICGAAIGIAVSAAALPLIKNLTPVQIPRLDEAGLDVRALAMCLGVVVVTTIVFGLVPALLLLRTQFSADLKSGERGSSKGARRIYSVLVATEVALACALLVSSALLVRTVGRMMDTPTGVDARDVVTTTVQLTQNTGPAAATRRSNRSGPCGSKTADLHSQIVEEIRHQPGVVAAGHSNVLPLEMGWRNPFLVRGEPRPARSGGSAAGADDQRQRRVLRGDGRAARQGPRVHALRWRRRRGRRHRERRFAKRFLADKEPVGETLLSWATGIGPLGLNLKAPAFQSHERHALRDRRRGGRCAERAARPGDRTGHLLHDQAVSVLGGLHRGPRGRQEQRANGDSQRAAKGDANRAHGHHANLGRAIRCEDRRGAAAHDHSRVLRGIGRRCSPRLASTACSRGRSRCARASSPFA